MGRRKKRPITRKGMKHLTLDERIVIETLLMNGKSPYVIAKTLEKSTSTITREIKNHTVIIPAKNDCLYYTYCKRKKTCKNNYYCNKLCKHCKTKDCHTVCHEYVKGYCEEIEKSPHVCNGCKNFAFCELEHRLYKASDAHKEYKAQLTDKRIGFDLTEEELEIIDRLVTPLIKAGHSPYAIKQELGDQIPCSEATLYRLINECMLEARNSDLQEKIRRKPRRHKAINKDAYAKISKAKKGHLYSDYLRYVKNNNIIAVQMDCVEGKKDDNAVILTLHWPLQHMQLYFMLEKQTAKSVVEALDKIETALGTELFKEVFPAILTDNGHEFSDVEQIERSCLSNENRTQVFFCEPNRSDEKANCERNHRLLRKVIGKRLSIEQYNQKDMTLISNHVNSYVRKSLGGISPYDIAMEDFDEDFFILLGLEKIPFEKVNLNPELVKK